MEQKTDMFFHARKRVNSSVRTHTLCVRAVPSKNKLLITWAKPWKGGWVLQGISDIFVKADSYSRKDGVRISSLKMDRLEQCPPRNVVSIKGVIPKKELYSRLPACVVDSLSWYISSAVRYFSISDGELALTTISIEGTKKTSAQHVREEIVLNLKDLVWETILDRREADKQRKEALLEAEAEEIL